MSTQNENSQIEDNVLSLESIQNIYAKLCIEEDTTFDILEESKQIENWIEECFDQKFRQIETKKLQEDFELLNTSFVKFLKFCFAKNFKKCGSLYIGYCDYFDLDYNKTFTSLHEKLQKLIKHACQCLIGPKCYQKYKNKLGTNETVKTPTLFELYMR